MVNLGSLFASLRQHFEPKELTAAARMAAVSLVVLAVLPNRAIDPWEAINPFKLWLLTLLICGLSLTGYAATHYLGRSRGYLIVGLAGALVSSTAVTLALARDSAGRAGHSAPLIAALLAAWAVMFSRVFVLAAVVNGPLALTVAIPLVLMCAVCLLCIRTCRTGSDQQGHASLDPETLPLTNPFSLFQAAKFAAFFAVLLIVIKLARSIIPGGGTLIIAALAGLNDVDAITLSMAQYAQAGGYAEVTEASRAIIVATLSNTAVKYGLVHLLGNRRLRRPLFAATIAVGFVGLCSLWLL